MTLTAIRWIHTVVWAFFVAAIVAVPVAAWHRRSELFWQVLGTLFLGGVVFGVVRLYVSG